MATSATPGRPSSVAMSPTANTSGCPGSERSGSTAMRPARSTSAPLAAASLAARGDAWTPAAQMAVRASIRDVAPPASATSTPRASTPTTRAFIFSSTPSRSSSVVALGGESIPEVRQRLLAAVQQQHPHRPRIEPTELALQAAHGQLPHLAGELDAGGPGADDDDRQPLRPLGRVRRHLGHLEGAEDAPAQLHGVVDRLHPRGVPSELVVAEVGLLAAGGDDQAVVGKLEVVQVGGRRRLHDPAVEIEVGHLGQLDAHVLGPPDDVPDRRRDLTRREHARRDLVEQGLEQVVVAAVDDRDVDRPVGEVADRQQPTEPPADDHDLVASRRSGHG